VVKQIIQTGFIAQLTMALIVCNSNMLRICRGLKQASKKAYKKTASNFVEAVTLANSSPVLRY